MKRISPESYKSRASDRESLSKKMTVGRRHRRWSLKHYTSDSSSEPDFSGFWYYKPPSFSLFSRQHFLPLHIR